MSLYKFRSPRKTLKRCIKESQIETALRPVLFRLCVDIARAIEDEASPTSDWSGLNEIRIAYYDHRALRAYRSEIASMLGYRGWHVQVCDAGLVLTAQGETR